MKINDLFWIFYELNLQTHVIIITKDYNIDYSKCDIINKFGNLIVLCQVQ